MATVSVRGAEARSLLQLCLSKIAEIVHAKGGLVYGDGANMNAAMGIVNPRKCGVDVMHLNLHKTFSTPHGGGGPRAGPVCVTEELDRFLPVPRAVKIDDRYVLDYDQPDSIGRVHAFHGNYSVPLRAYACIRTMGAENLKKASQLAVLNAAYIKEKLKGTLPLAYDRPCMHECVFSDALLQENKVATLDLGFREKIFSLLAKYRKIFFTEKIFPLAAANKNDAIPRVFSKGPKVFVILRHKCSLA